MSAQIFDGKALLARLEGRIKRDARLLRKNFHIDVGLGILLVTGDQVSMSESGKIASRAEELGITVKLESVAKRNISRRFYPILDEWNKSPFIQGTYIQLPLPADVISLDEVMKRLPPNKDVGGIHFINRGKATYPSSESGISVTPPEILAVAETLESCGFALNGGNVVLIGSLSTSGIVRLMAGYLYDRGCNVRLVKWESIQGSKSGMHQRKLNLEPATENRPEKVLNPDNEVVITWANQPAWLTREKLSHGSIIIDMGYKFARGRISGDCDFPSVSPTAKIMTPVPGGLHNIIHVMILRNLIDLIKRQTEEMEYGSAGPTIRRKFQTMAEGKGRRLKG